MAAGFYSCSFFLLQKTLLPGGATLPQPPLRHREGLLLYLLLHPGGNFCTLAFLVAFLTIAPGCKIFSFFH